jgi:hypothetical protein
MIPNRTYSGANQEYLVFQVRRIIIIEWLALSPDKRKTKQQAATFALKAAHRHQFDCRATGTRQ